jgi:selenophosphate synthetase-related protein
MARQVGHTGSPVTDLAALAETIRTAPGLRAKRDLDLVARTLAGLDGDDAALVPFDGGRLDLDEGEPGAHRGRLDLDEGEEGPVAGQLVLAGEAITPGLVAADPFTAGAAAVVANVADVRAMGGRPVALVDMLVSPDRAHAQRVLDGLRWAADLLAVPIAGGHLTIGGTAALSAVCAGRVTVPLRAAAARPGDALLAAFCLEGRYRDQSPFFSSLRDRAPERLRTDGEALVEVAERGLCHAARDVSMPGAGGSLLQLLELAGCGATLDLDRLPRPGGVPLERWLVTFPSFGFVLAAPPGRAQEACAVFHARALDCAVCGTFDDTRTLRIAWGSGGPAGRSAGQGVRGAAAGRTAGERTAAAAECLAAGRSRSGTATVWDLAAEPLTALGD